MKIKRTDCNYFDPLAFFVISTVSLGLSFEVYRGKPGPYKIKDHIVLDAKQLGKRLVLYPYVLLNDFLMTGKWPEEIEIIEESRKKPPDTVELKMGPLELPYAHILSSMFGNYYERNIDLLKSKFASFDNWPDVWKFGWAIRNACFHDGCIYIRNKRLKVSWKDITYNHSCNGQSIINIDLFPADFVYLMMEMDEFIK